MKISLEACLNRLEKHELPPNHINNLDLSKDISGGGIPGTVGRREETKEQNNLNLQAELKLAKLAKKVDTVLDKFKLALYKLIPDNYSVVVEEILKLKDESPESSKYLAENIFKNAWKQQEYVKVYAKLCKEIIHWEMEESLMKN